MPTARQRGSTLLELLAAALILGAFAALVAPWLLGATTSLRVEMAAHELVSTLRLARSYAIRHSTRVAVRFDPAGIGDRPSFALYRDGDGDGVRNDDIDRGLDPPVRGDRTLGHFDSPVGFGIPAGLRPTDPGDPRRLLDRLDDPIRFNNSNLASFDPLGTSTPGTLYLTDGRTVLYAVRVSNRTGRVRLLRFDPVERSWRPR